MAEPTCPQVAVAFSDVAVYFSEEEWGRLEDWQKELYGNAIREIHAALVSLGYVIVNPETLFRIKKEEGEPYFWNAQGSAGGRFSCCSATGIRMVNSDLPPNLKEEDEAYSLDSQSPEETGSKNHYPIITSVLSVSIKDEDQLNGLDQRQYGRRDGLHFPTTSHTIGHPTNILMIKEDGETYYSSHYDIGESDGMEYITIADPVVNHQSGDLLPNAKELTLHGIRVAGRPSKQRRRKEYATYTPRMRFETGKYASENGVMKAVRWFLANYQSTINESTVRTFKRDYLSRLKEAPDPASLPHELPTKPRGRPPLLHKRPSRFQARKTSTSRMGKTSFSYGED
ncbi:zinc finger protein 282-like isoform X2 [Rhinatrema bivittatum]|uniref:zinc finger protein 282-like isoform X2 n=1 Tax=Rhinatrema bivittatum TaxID=194408 RepID=UPI00112B9FD5|nr:zinc finger protein 282-like isoform X2 [Rhinatrema bivittatum]